MPKRRAYRKARGAAASSSPPPPIRVQEELPIEKSSLRVDVIEDLSLNKMCPDCGRELMRPKIFVFGVAKDILEAYSPMQRRLVENHIVSIIAQPFRPSHMVQNWILYKKEKETTSSSD